MSALNKWKWLSKATTWVKKNFGDIPGVNLVCDTIDVINNQFRFAEANLSTNENELLSKWEEELFLPFLEYIFRKQAIIYNNNATELEKIKIVNSIIIESNAVMMYYGMNPDNISEKASQVRIEYVNKFMVGIQDNIYNNFIGLLSYNLESITSTVDSVILNIKPLNVNSSFTVDLIKVEGVATIDTVATPTDSNAAINETTAIVPLVTNVNQSTNTNSDVPNTTSSSPSIIGIGIFLIASFFALKYAFKKSE